MQLENYYSDVTLMVFVRSGTCHVHMASCFHFIIKPWKQLQWALDGAQGIFWTHVSFKSGFRRHLVADSAEKMQVLRLQVRENEARSFMYFFLADYRRLFIW